MSDYYRAPCHRSFNRAVVEAELAGETKYAGSPCSKDPKHVRKDGTTIRDTVKRCCIACKNEKAIAYNERLDARG